MPRNYVPIPNKKRSHGYSTYENLMAAARDVKVTNISYRKAAEKHDVKRATLKDFVSGGITKKRKLGRTTLFTAVEEKELAKVVDAVVEWGFPVGSLDVRLLAKSLAVKKNIKIKTKSGIPGEDWYSVFAIILKSHTCVSVRIYPML